MRGWSEHAVADVQLRRVNESLSIETRVAGLHAFRFEPRFIFDSIAYAVEHDEPMRARRQNRHRQHRHERGTPGKLGDAAILGEIVESEHEAGKPGRPRTGRDAFQRKYGAGRLDHHP